MAEKIVSIFGTSKAKEGDAVYKIAYETGKILVVSEGFVLLPGTKILRESPN